MKISTKGRYALRLMLADKMEELMRIQVDAVKGIKIDKVTVWDGGEQKDGKTATAGFVSGLMKTIPPMSEMFDMAGMNLPEFLGKKQHGISEFAAASLAMDISVMKEAKDAAEEILSDRQAMAEASPLIHRAWSRLEAMEGEIARN